MPGRILLVEDQTVMRELLVEVLAADSRFEVVGAYDAASGLLRDLRRVSADVAVVDYALPGLNGIEIAKRLMPRGVKTVLLTAYEHPGLLRDAVAAGIHGVVSKSAPLGVVKDAVARVLAGERYRCPTTASALRSAHPSTGSALTPREVEVVRLVAGGLTSKEIASRLGLSEKTVVNHRTNVMRKLGVHDAISLTRYALERGLLSAG